MVMPEFEFSDEDLARVRAKIGTAPSKPVSPIADTISGSLPRKRGRRRTAGQNPEPINQQPELASDQTLGFQPAPLISVDERLFAQRLQGFMEGTTGIAGAFVKPYLAMTQDEAQAIAEPLASYLIKRAPDSEMIREFVENYDLLAIITGVGAYTARVYHDRKDDVEQQRIERAQSVRSATNVASRNVYEEPSQSNGQQEISPRYPVNDFNASVPGTVPEP